MPQTFVPPENITGDQFVLTPKEAHHLIRVQRKKEGDEITLFDGKGRRFRGKITHLSAGEPLAQGKITQTLPEDTKTCRIHLFQGLPKGARFDYVIEKATELGADTIVPFLSQKNVIQLDPAQAEKKRTRWDRVAEAAAKQCEREDLPSIEAPAPLESLAHRFESRLTLVFSKGKDSSSLKSTLGEIFGEGKVAPDQINVVIGPESGFSEEEVAWFKRKGAHLVHMGPRTLRTETAALTALSILTHELGI